MDLKKTDGGVTERSGRIATLLERDTLQEMSTRQQTDNILDCLNGEAKVDNAFIQQCKQTVLLTA